MNLMSDDLGVSEAIIGQLVTLYALTFAICGPILVKLITSCIIMDFSHLCSR